MCEGIGKVEQSSFYADVAAVGGLGPAIQAQPEKRAALGPEKPYTMADAKGRLLGQGDAAEAVDWIVRHLPPNCGPAVHGTVEDLD
jgi:hypothetical protein